MITKDMIIADFMEQYPEKVYILKEIGFPCIGCFLSAEETLEMGCMEAGIDVYELIDKLNEDVKEETQNYDSGIINYDDDKKDE